jgi:hypothetical protein
MRLIRINRKKFFVRNYGKMDCKNDLLVPILRSRFLIHPLNHYRNRRYTGNDKIYGKSESDEIM